MLLVNYSLYGNTTNNNTLVIVIIHVLPKEKGLYLKYFNLHVLIWGLVNLIVDHEDGVDGRREAILGSVHRQDPLQRLVRLQYLEYIYLSFNTTK